MKAYQFLSTRSIIIHSCISALQLFKMSEHSVSKIVASFILLENTFKITTHLYCCLVLKKFNYDYGYNPIINRIYNITTNKYYKNFIFFASLICYYQYGINSYYHTIEINKNKFPFLKNYINKYFDYIYKNILIIYILPYNTTK